MARLRDGRRIPPQERRCPRRERVPVRRRWIVPPRRAEIADEAATSELPAPGRGDELQASASEAEAPGWSVGPIGRGDEDRAGQVPVLVSQLGIDVTREPQKGIVHLLGTMGASEGGVKICRIGDASIHRTGTGNSKDNAI